MRAWQLLLMGAISVACGCATSKGEVFGRLSERVVHLANGDSVELQATMPAVLPDEKPGTMVIYYPFRDLDDTLRLRQTAIALLANLRPQLDSAPPPFLVLRAVNRRASERHGFYQLRNYGVVVERHSDGHWYLWQGSEPVL